MHTITHLWLAARGLFSSMWEAIGDHRALAKRWIDRDEAREIARWLEPIEALVRQLLLIEALQTPPSATKPRPAAPHARAHKSQRRYSFRIWTKPAPHPARIRSLGPPILVRDIYAERARLAAAQHLQKHRYLRKPIAERLARRIEALYCVIEKPMRAIKSLARKLRTWSKLAIRMLMRRTPRSPHNNELASREANLLAWRLAPPLDTS